MDLAEHYIQEFQNAGIPKTESRPFLNKVFKQLASMGSGAMKRQVLEQSCEEFLKLNK